MNKNLLFRLTLVVTVVATLFLSGCGGDSIEQQRLSKEAEDIVNEAYDVRDCHDIVEALKADTTRFRDGAEPNDDLTLLAFSFTTS